MSGQAHHVGRDLRKGAGAAHPHGVLQFCYQRFGQRTDAFRSRAVDRRHIGAGKDDRIGAQRQRFKDVIPSATPA